VQLDYPILEGFSSFTYVGRYYLEIIGSGGLQARCPFCMSPNQQCLRSERTHSSDHNQRQSPSGLITTCWHTDGLLRKGAFSPWMAAFQCWYSVKIAVCMCIFCWSILAWRVFSGALVSTGMGDVFGPVCNQPAKYQIDHTQPCISLGSLNWVPALIGGCKGGNVRSARWQVTLCDPI